MTFKIAVGQAYSVQGRDAVTQAIYEGLLSIGNEPVALAVVIASYEYDFQDILNGAMTQLGDVPLIGFSTSGEMTSEGKHRRSVVVALIADEDIDSKAAWLPGFAEASRHTTTQIAENLSLDTESEGILLAVADGLGGDYETMLTALPKGKFQFAGCLAGGDLRLGRTFQIGGDKVGAGGLAAAMLKGAHFRMGVGAAHGWSQVGTSFKVTRARGPWIRALDGKPASDSYAALFGRRTRDWAFPPLNTLVRLYPLGIQDENGTGMTLRTPLRVEADGSLRMSADVPDGSTGHLMIGSTERCMEAARTAASDALRDLGTARPKLALIFADVSWEMLLKGQPGNEVDAVQDVLGNNVPIAGGYTFGQLAHFTDAPAPQLLNQHIQVVIIGEEE